MKKYNMRFHFTNASLLVQGLDAEAKVRYSEKCKFEVPFVVVQPAITDAWMNMPEQEYIVNPNMVTYVEITTRNV